MAESLRRYKEKPPAYWETIRERIDCGAAVTTINRVVNGDTGVAIMQAQMAWQIVNKLLPSLQAVAIQVQAADPLTRYDLDALMLSSGIDPASLDGWDDNKQLISQEKVESPADPSDTPLPPDDSA